MYNAYLALRSLKAGDRVAYPARSGGSVLLPHRPGETGPSYVTRRGDNYLMLAFSFGVDLERFRSDNALWRVQVPFEGIRLVVNERAEPKVAAGITADPVDSAIPPRTAAAVAPPPAGLAAAPLPAPAPLIHKVRRGETLQKLALRYAVSAEAIASENKLSRQARLVTGQILKIPLEAR
jgi:LysM repeat protein